MSNPISNTDQDGFKPPMSVLMLSSSTKVKQLLLRWNLMTGHVLFGCQSGTWSCACPDQTVSSSIPCVPRQVWFQAVSLVSSLFGRVFFDCTAPKTNKTMPGRWGLLCPQDVGKVFGRSVGPNFGAFPPRCMAHANTIQYCNNYMHKSNMRPQTRKCHNPE